MNREIKFRVWDKDLKRMRYLNTEHDFIRFHSSGQGYYENMQTGPGKWFSDLMQYTGLKDKNGKEIYEGDIISYIFGKPNGDSVEVYSETVEFNYGQLLHLTYADYLEVIGNIYEREKENEHK